MPEFTTLVGNLTRDPHYMAATEQRPSEFVAFTVANNPTFTPQSAPKVIDKATGEVSDKVLADYIEVEFNSQPGRDGKPSQAKVIADALSKGRQVTVIGEKIPAGVAWERYTKADGTKDVKQVLITKLRANSIQFGAMPNGGGQRQQRQETSAPSVDDLPYGV